MSVTIRQGGGDVAEIVFLVEGNQQDGCVALGEAIFHPGS